MRFSKTALVFMFMLVIGGCNFSDAKFIVDDIAINVSAPGRIFSFTNKSAGQYSGQTHSRFKNGWEGWISWEQKIFNDYAISLDNNEPDRASAKATVYPYKLYREYPGGAAETLLLPDNKDDLYLEVQNGNLTSIELLGIKVSSVLSKSDNRVTFSLTSPGNDSLITISSEKKINSFNIQPDKLKITFNGETNNTLIMLSLSRGEGSSAIRDSYEIAMNAKRGRINSLLAELGLETDNPELTKAVLWAVASLDALITRQQVTGIFAGLPWFNNYWGRDTFISIPGATFVSGNFKDAREILLNFASYQNTDPDSRYYGRIPNRITLNETIYNTVDGTPWFVIQAYNYYKYSGDLDFLRRIYPQVKLAFTSFASLHNDGNGFLTHEDAETWMDAVGPKGPWSPRGNRAVDIQALWYRQLLSTVSIADLMNDPLISAQAATLAVKLKENFAKFFINPAGTMIYDRLKKDGSPDPSIRPNLFFALNESSLIDDFRSRLNIIETAMQNLVLPYGVLSLSHKDENFHPFHEYPPYYPKDAAYHNGIIWQWNTGPVVQALCSFGLQDTAWVLTSELTKQLLTRGAAGTIAELSEAFPRAGETEIRLSGTFSQAWSLAEYIRNFYQDYLGVSPDAPNNVLYLIPYLPSSLKEISFNQKVGANKVRVRYSSDDKKFSVEVDPLSIKNSMDIAISLINKAGANYLMRTAITEQEKLSFEVPAYATDSAAFRAMKNDKPVEVASQFYLDPVSNKNLYDKIQISRLDIPQGIKSIRPPDYPLLNINDIKKTENETRVIISAADKPEDEKYEYPTNQNFADGILDIERFEISEGKEDYYFRIKMRNLNDPGWHPEYGFQLTLLAVCIATDATSGRTDIIGENSGYQLSGKRKFDRKIMIGGGFEIKDASGKIIASYIPQPGDIRNPLGSTKEKTISFAVPKKLIGKLSTGSVVTILSGAQDDHGGAGIGEFRLVNKNRSEWNGGGKKEQDADNIYDILEIN